MRITSLLAECGIDADAIVRCRGWPRRWVIAVAVQVDARNAERHAVAERDVDHPLALDRIIVAIFALGRGFERPELGLGGDHVDHARRCVAAEQRTLRPAQNFDALQVIEFGFEQAGRKQRVAVQMDRGRAVAGGADAKVTDAADRKAGAGKVGFCKGHIGQGQLQIRRRLDLLRFQGFGRKGADRDRHVLEPFGLTLCRDDDFAAERVAFDFLRRILRPRGCCHRHRKNRRSDQSLELHLQPPFFEPAHCGAAQIQIVVRGGDRTRHGKGCPTETAGCPGVSHLPAVLVIVLSHRRRGKTPASPDHDPLERVL